LQTVGTTPRRSHEGGRRGVDQDKCRNGVAVAGSAWTQKTP
jgi:hypothetical protein